MDKRRKRLGEQLRSRRARPRSSARWSGVRWRRWPRWWKNQACAST